MGGSSLLWNRSARHAVEPSCRGSGRRRRRRRVRPFSRRPRCERLEPSLRICCSATPVCVRATRGSVLDRRAVWGIGGGHVAKYTIRPHGIGARVRGLSTAALSPGWTAVALIVLNPVSLANWKVVRFRRPVGARHIRGGFLSMRQSGCGSNARFSRSPPGLPTHHSIASSGAWFDRAVTGPTSDHSSGSTELSTDQGGR